jgi:hypothetical protein
VTDAVTDLLGVTDVVNDGVFVTLEVCVGVTDNVIVLEGDTVPVRLEVCEGVVLDELVGVGLGELVAV